MRGYVGSTDGEAVGARSLGACHRGHLRKRAEDLLGYPAAQTAGWTSALPVTEETW